MGRTKKELKLLELQLKPQKKRRIGRPFFSNGLGRTDNKGNYSPKRKAEAIEEIRAGLDETRNSSYNERNFHRLKSKRIGMPKRRNSILLFDR